MSRARVVITAVVVQGRSRSEVAKTYGIARSWVDELVAHYLAEGDGTRRKSRGGTPTPVVNRWN